MPLAGLVAILPSFTARLSAADNSPCLLPIVFADVLPSMPLTQPATCSRDSSVIGVPPSAGAMSLARYLR